MENKFLYIRESKDEGTLIASDGGVAIIWHNGEHLVGQCYCERLDKEHFEKGFTYALEEMINCSSNSAMFDFENEHEVHPLNLEDLADWLVAGIEGSFMESLILIDATKCKESTIDKRVKSFLKKTLNTYFIDTCDVIQYKGERIVDEVTIVKKPKKTDKTVLVHSPKLQANILVYKRDLI